MGMQFDGREEAEAKEARRVSKSNGGAKARAAREAAQAEAEDAPIEFEYDGQTYVVAPAIEWDVEVFESAEDGKIVSAVRALLGPKQWDIFKSGKKKRTLPQVSELFDAAKAALGVTPGE